MVTAIFSRGQAAALDLVADSCVFASWMSRSAEICPLILLIIWSVLMICCNS